MRKNMQTVNSNDKNAFKIIAIDDEEGIIDSLSIFLNRSRIFFYRCN